MRARTGRVNTARRLTKSYGERLRGRNVHNLNPEKAEGLSPELQLALHPLLSATAELKRADLRVQRANREVSRRE